MSAAAALLQGRPLLGQGSWHLGAGRRERATEAEALRTGIALGLRLIDTAEMYGDGRSEALIGEVLRSLPAGSTHPFIVSKVLPHNASRRGVLRACAASRERLGVDCIDLYLLHWRGPTPLAETVAAFEQLQAEGHIRHWGVSNFDTDDMQQLWQVPGGTRCAANQVLYHVRSRGIEYELLPWCQQHGVAVMAYCPLGHRDLIGDALLADIGARHGASGPAVALAWALRGGQVIAIPESGLPAHVQGNARALALQLDDEDLRRIDADSPPPTRRQPLDML